MCQPVKENDSSKPECLVTKLAPSPEPFLVRRVSGITTAQKTRAVNGWMISYPQTMA